MWHKQLIIFKYFYLLIEISQSIQSNSVTTTHFCHHNTKYMNVPSKLQNTMSLCFRDSENLPWQWCRGMIVPAIFSPCPNEYQVSQKTLLSEVISFSLRSVFLGHPVHVQIIWFVSNLRLGNTKFANFVVILYNPSFFTLSLSLKLFSLPDLFFTKNLLTQTTRVPITFPR